MKIEKSSVVSDCTVNESELKARICLAVVKPERDLVTLEKSYIELDCAIARAHSEILNAYAEFMENNFGLDRYEVFEYADKKYDSSELGMLIEDEIDQALRIVSERMRILRKLNKWTQA